MTPLKSIRLKCRSCAGSSQAVEACDFTNCGLWPYRFGHRSKEADLTPVKAIRRECLDCCRGSFNEVSLCPVEDCPLFPYRFGKNPARAGLGNRDAVPPWKRGLVQDSEHNEPGTGWDTSLPPDDSNPLPDGANMDQTMDGGDER